MASKGRFSQSMYVLVIWMQGRQEKSIKTKRKMRPRVKPIGRKPLKRDPESDPISHGAKCICNGFRSYDTDYYGPV